MLTILPYGDSGHVGTVGWHGTSDRPRAEVSDGTQSDHETITAKGLYMPPRAKQDDMVPSDVPPLTDHELIVGLERAVNELISRIEQLTEAVNTVGQQQQWMTEATAASQNQLKDALKSGGIGGMLKLAKGLMSGKDNTVDGNFNDAS